MKALCDGASNKLFKRSARRGVEGSDRQHQRYHDTWHKNVRTPEHLAFSNPCTWRMLSVKKKKEKKERKVQLCDLSDTFLFLSVGDLLKIAVELQSRSVRIVLRHASSPEHLSNNRKQAFSDPHES